jgi:anaerobic dimethyl sulfoxide reductase subunit B
MTYAFTFDASSCSGCKACQAACKDKNNLPTGVLWRRVFEVSGGAWTNVGVGSPDPGVGEHVAGEPRTYSVWENTVFAYNLSMACNHCAHPKCAGVCPVDAYSIREDGIVCLDTTKCIGCGYCAWACPYAAPQYNPEAGHMSKCDFCCDNLDAGLPPACVAACPMRVLDFVTVGGGQLVVDSQTPLWEIPGTEHPFPLPQYSHTEPHLAIKSHAGMLNGIEKTISNREEVQPRRISAWEEAPLMAFTLLSQMAVGGFWTMQWIFPQWWSIVEYDTTFLRFLPSLLIGLCLGVGMLISFTHLGTKRNAWRALTHLRKSWLSREILFAGLFGTGWLVATLTGVNHPPVPSPLLWLTALLAFAFIHSMSQVYRLSTAPAWDTWRTDVSFLLSTLLLGLLVMVCVLAFESQLTGIPISAGQWGRIGLITLVLLTVRLALVSVRSSYKAVTRLQVGLILAGLLGTAIFFIPRLAGFWTSLPVFLFVLTEEGVGRWLFYQSRE